MTTHYLNQWWPKFMTPYDVTISQWVNKSWCIWQFYYKFPENICCSHVQSTHVTFKSQCNVDTNNCVQYLLCIKNSLEGWHGDLSLVVNNWIWVPRGRQYALHSFISVMTTSSNGNIFRVTGHLCGEFTGDRWIPRKKASDAELWCFLWSAPE